MRRRWSVILPVIGMALFLGQTWVSYRDARDSKDTDAKYFWWGTVRLDSDPLNQRSPFIRPCKPEGAGAACWDPVTVDRYPGAVQQTLAISALPAYAISVVLTAATSRLGLSQVPVFLFSFGALTYFWFLGIGWLLDRRRWRKLQSAKLATDN